MFQLTESGVVSVDEDQQYLLMSGISGEVTMMPLEMTVREGGCWMCCYTFALERIRELAVQQVEDIPIEQMSSIN